MCIPTSYMYVYIYTYQYSAVVHQVSEKMWVLRSPFLKLKKKKLPTSVAGKQK